VSDTHPHSEDHTITDITAPLTLPTPEPSFTASDWVSQGIAESRVKTEHGDIAGLPTGVPTLDAGLKHGLERGRLTTIAAESGVGKTALIGQLAVAIARQARVLLFAFEEDKPDLANRLLAIVGDIDIGGLRGGFAGGAFPDEQVADAAAYLHSLGVEIVDSDGMTVEAIVVKTADWMRREKAALGDKADAADFVVLVDQLSHIHDTPANHAPWFQRQGFPVPSLGAQEWQRMEWKAHVLKQLAAKAKAVVILAVQLNEVKVDEEPTKYLVRSARGVVHKSDIVLAVWRPKTIADPASEGHEMFYDAKPKRVANDDDITYLKAVKARGIQEFTVTLRFDGKHQRLVELADRGGTYRKPAPQTAAQLEGRRKLAAVRERFEAQRAEQAAAQLAAGGGHGQLPAGSPDVPPEPPPPYDEPADDCEPMPF